MIGLGYSALVWASFMFKDFFPTAEALPMLTNKHLSPLALPGQEIDKFNQPLVLQGFFTELAFPNRVK